MQAKLIINKPVEFIAEASEKGFSIHLPKTIKK